MTRRAFPRVAALKTADAFRQHLSTLGLTLPFDDTLAGRDTSPLGEPLGTDGLTIGNRFSVLPMEGWDGELDGTPSDFTRRRWRHFGQSGAKFIWGGEAVAVRHDGRASPNQLQITTRTQPAIAALREELVRAHRDRHGANADGDLVVGLQLTHSGRFAKPDASDRPAPLTACVNPVLDDRVPHTPHVLTDDELDRLIDDFVVAARLARDAGFDFVDVKQCHGYLGHELLGARNRPGKYGGSLENRFRFLRTVIEAIRAGVPGLRIGVRLSAVDLTPYRKDPDGVGEPAPLDPVSQLAGFGIVVNNNLDAALEEPRALLAMLASLGVRWICVTAGSPYYTPHVIRPAYFPPMDGYQPPEDPLVGVARHIETTGRLKRAFPDMVFVGSGYTYLQEWLPHVAQSVIRQGLADFVGLGRMMLSYPDFAADVLAGRPLKRGTVCRTFSDCTTGPRLGLVSGCYPLDEYYKTRPDAAAVLKVRTAMNAGE
jgi:2,4-dienoyl-CoA reductase-like NADH-dependent reductase (Old Yellow Enzyme family)